MTSNRGATRRLWLPAAVGLAAALLIIQTGSQGAKPQTTTGDNEDLYKELELFEHALAIVRSDYVEEPKAHELIYGALKGMLATLDPYSQFLDPDSYNELKVETEGEFGGLGIEITIKDDLLTIISPIDDTPAYRAGLQAGDRIVKIDGELTRGITLIEAVKKLRGKPKSQVGLTILREGEGELKEFMVERAIIKIQSVREATVLGDRIGYVRVSDFREQTTRDLDGALSQLKDLDGLILDLRNNPGGLLDVAVSVSELFLKHSQLIVSTKGRLANQNMQFFARSDGAVNKVPLVVLINEGSASASEIVAGAIQDHHRGILLGTKSHGKGSVQTIFPLKDGSALRLTTSRWFTPDGRPIHGQGIRPDVEVPFERRPEPDEKERAKENAKQLFDRVESNGKDSQDAQNAKEPQNAKDAQEAKDTKEAAGSLAEKLRNDTQLARAVDLLKGIRVYQSRENATP